MSLQIKMELPTSEIQRFGMNEDSVFETYFEGDALWIRMLREEELQEELGEAEQEAMDERMAEQMERCFQDGYHVGYADGFRSMLQLVQWAEDAEPAEKIW